MKIVISLIVGIFAAAAGWGIYLARTYTPPEYVPVPSEQVFLPPSDVPTPVSPVHTPVAGTVAGDTQPPGTPGGLSAVAVGTGQINLSWRASQDDVRVLGYDIYRDGILIGSSTDTFFGDIDLPVGNQFSYSVIAYDATGNVSVPSVTVFAGRGTPMPQVAVATGTPTAIPVATSSPASTPPPTSAPVPTSTPVPTPIPPTPTPTPTPASSGCGSGGGCTAVQVATHNTQGNCWVYLRTINKVYNITGYVANPGLHPGGNVIIPFCGQDIYDYFLGNAGGHRHSNSALNNTLQAYYIGSLI